MDGQAFLSYNACPLKRRIEKKDISVVRCSTVVEVTFLRTKNDRARQHAFNLAVHVLVRAVDIVNSRTAVVECTRIAAPVSERADDDDNIDAFTCRKSLLIFRNKPKAKPTSHTVQCIHSM